VILGIAGIEYWALEMDLQTLFGPVIAPGAGGREETVRQRAVPAPQFPIADTQTAPVPVKDEPTNTLIEVPVFNPTIVIPAGTVQL
jgi:hypothetical protein